MVLIAVFLNLVQMYFVLVGLWVGHVCKCRLMAGIFCFCFCTSWLGGSVCGFCMCMQVEGWEFLGYGQLGLISCVQDSVS